MGFTFSLEHASLAGWLTRRYFPKTSEFDFLTWHDRRNYRLRAAANGVDEDDNELAWKAPRASRSLLYSFLEELPNAYLTNDVPWRDEFRRLVEISQERLRHAEYDSDRADLAAPLQSRVVADVLRPLRHWFDVPFYFLAIGSQWVPHNVLAGSPDWTLWLQGSDGKMGVTDLLDPFPAIRLAAQHDPETPATLCWNASGEAVLVPGKTEELVRRVHRVPPQILWSELQSWAQKPPSGFTVLHLSDLHFGSRHARDHLAYMEQHLRSVFGASYGRLQPVVTGDLMDTPNEQSFAEFNAFRNRLTAMAGTRVFIIPGNHYVKSNGFMWFKYKLSAELEWSHVVDSEVAKATFLSFNSSRDATLARGKISKDQFRAVATAIGEQDALRDRADRLRIVLVHHHPFSIEEDEHDTVPFIRIREEPTLRMENGQELVDWCARMDVPLILHGHKHKQRYIGREVLLDGFNKPRMVRAVGCGTSLGAEGKPLSYNVITWQPDRREWLVSFFSDPGDGSGFVERRIAAGRA